MKFGRTKIYDWRYFMMGILCLGMGWGCSSKQTVLDQLIGNWRGEQSGIDVSESWKFSEEEGYSGQGEVKDQEYVMMTEEMRIIDTDSGWFYVAHPSVALTATPFKIQAWTEDGFRAENRNHDYPQVISYQIQGDTLITRLEGPDMNGTWITEEMKMIRE